MSTTRVLVYLAPFLGETELKTGRNLNAVWALPGFLGNTLLSVPLPNGFLLIATRDQPVTMTGRTWLVDEAL